MEHPFNQVVLAIWETWSHSVCTVDGSTTEIITSASLVHTSVEGWK